MSTFADLTKRRAVVTGASTGIGRATAVELARGGADVVVHCARSVDAAEKTAEAVRAFGRRAEVLAADFADRERYAGFVEDAWTCFGGVDVWVNNAGVDLLTGEAGAWPFERKLQAMFDVDVRSTLEISRDVGRRMQAARQSDARQSDAVPPVILTIGWDQADRGMEGDSGELFAALKNAVMGFTRSLAVSLAPDVRVNCIAPGWIRTKWGESAGEDWQNRVLRETPLKRWGTPEDVARTARFLASDEAAYITGQVINVNGGAVR